MDEVANPLIVIDSQYFLSFANSHALLKIGDNILSLPLYPSLKISELKYIVSKIDEFFKK